MARLYKQVRAAEARVRQAEQETSPSQSSPPEFAKHQPEFAKQQPECAKQRAESEFAKQHEAQASDEGVTPPPAENTTAVERHTQLRAIASDLLYWKGGLNVLRMAQLPKWRGSFQWQIEVLQAEDARLSAEVANGGG